VTSAVSTTAATAVSRSTCFVAGEQHVAGDARPHQPDDRPAAVGGVHARAPGLDQRPAQRRQLVDHELALGVERPGGAGALGWEHPVGPDDLSGRSSRTIRWSQMASNDDVVAPR
jgi:hypothetical protein